jgi:hypothetical protein
MQMAEPRMRSEMNLFSQRRELATALLSIFFLPILSNAQIAWVKSFDTALRQAKAENKYIYLDISASW